MPVASTDSVSNRTGTSQGERAVCLSSKTVILIRDSVRPVDSISY